MHNIPSAIPKLDTSKHLPDTSPYNWYTVNITQHPYTFIHLLPMANPPNTLDEDNNVEFQYLRNYLQAL